MIRKDVAIAAIGLSLIVSACSGSAESQGAPPPPQVTVATPLVSEIVDWDDFVGRFEAIEEVEVKPRVSGYLVGIHFRDGQYVRRGQLLFTIDARPAQAQLDQARAPARAGRGAGCVNARTELARSRTLAAQQAASVEEVEQRQAALRSAHADVAAARANRSGAAARRRLHPGLGADFGPGLRAPGRPRQCGHRRPDGADDRRFDQSAAFRLRRLGGAAASLSSGRTAASRLGAPVRIRLQDEAQYVHAGRLDFVDNSLNAGAGTIRGTGGRAQPRRLPEAGDDGPPAAGASPAYPRAAGARHGDRHRRRAPGGLCRRPAGHGRRCGRSSSARSTAACG